MSLSFDKANPRSFIVCAACKHGAVIIAGARHFDKIMHTQLDLIEEKVPGTQWEQGFIDQFGNFYNRVEALDTIRKNKLQFIDYERNGSTEELYSEGLY